MIVESTCIIQNPLDSLHFLFRSILFRSFPRQLPSLIHAVSTPGPHSHNTTRTRPCSQPVSQQQPVCAQAFPACHPPPPPPLPKRCRPRRPSRYPPSFPSLRTTPRRGRRTSALAQRVNQVHASSRPSWICSPTPSARWSSLRTSQFASFTAARPPATVVSQLQSPGMEFS